MYCLMSSTANDSTISRTSRYVMLNSADLMERHATHPSSTWHKEFRGIRTDTAVERHTSSQRKPKAKSKKKDEQKKNSSFPRWHRFDLVLRWESDSPVSASLPKHSLQMLDFSVSCADHLLLMAPVPKHCNHCERNPIFAN